MVHWGRDLRENVTEKKKESIISEESFGVGVWFTNGNKLERSQEESEEETTQEMKISKSND